MKFVNVAMNFSELPVPDLPLGGAMDKMIEKLKLPEGTDVDVQVQGKEASVALKIPVPFLDQLLSQSGNMTITSVELADE